MGRVVRLGTRGSALARWQTDYVARLLQGAHPDIQIEIEVITTTGDRVLDTPLPLVGGKGVFTAELEAALHSGAIDFAVHSLKDLPTEASHGLTIGAIPERANPADVFISRSACMFDEAPLGATIGTSSRRRAAQLLHRRPDLNILDVRGNVDTRIRKALDPDGPYDAIVLAHAGVARLGRLDVVTHVLSLDDMLPAPGQGALGVQCRDDAESLTILESINHRETALNVSAERAFLAGLGGGCSLPVAAYALIDGGHLYLRGRVNTPDGVRQIDVNVSGRAEDITSAEASGRRLAQLALEKGAAEILESVI